MKYIIFRFASNKIVLLLMLSIIFCQCGMSSSKKSEKEVNKISPNHNEEIDDKSVQLSDEMIQKLNIELTKVNKKEIKSSLSATAIILPVQDLEAIVGSIIDGRVHNIFVNQGDYVKKGQVLAKIMNFQIGEMKGEYIKSKVEFAFTKENLERAKNLFENNISSKKSLLLAQAEYEKAEAEYLSASEKLSSIGLTDKEVYGVSANENLPIIDIMAPISGKIVERNITVGEYIESTKTLFKIIDISKVWVDAVVYEKDISKIKLGQKVEIVVNAYPDLTCDGKVIYISDVINNETKTLTIRTTVNNPENILKPNMFSTVKIYYREERRLLAINSSAIESDNDETFVFVEEENNLFKKRDVKCGIESEGLTEIISGLKEGENVVVRGSFALRSELEKTRLEGTHQH